MSEQYLGEIRLFSCDFAPSGWAFCEGQILNIAQNQALFALLGTTYGGDGRTTFALPDLRGRVPIHFNNTFPLGNQQGEQNHTLTINEMPAHNHLANASNTITQTTPANYTWGTAQSNLYGPATSLTPMNQSAIGTAGGSQPHSNMQPYLALHFCIALTGIFPSRN